MPSQFGTVYEKVQSCTADFTYNSGATVSATTGAPDLLLVDTTSGNITVTLPSALGNYSNASNGQGPFRIINTGATGYAVNIAAAGGTVYSNTRLLGQYSSGVYTSDGVTGWFDGALIGVAAEVQTSLSAAQILAMRATPVTIVPAPGASKIILVESITLKMVRTSTQFASGGAVEYRYTDGSGAKVTADMSSTLVTGAAGTAYASCAGVTTELTPVANAAVVITNATGAFTTGTGTGVVTCKYRVVVP